ncbi:hypothetical protein AAW51_3773 [Caldimonas brevitalea]|uniref:Uncharacterized protein n=1 Tax=Caldimonas brevitalea TaxID=413882 RepID=A0A0G3BM02_9BURK|nr:hypothetical protein AAW51_3773 [Caldimonas brevitalea]
MGGFAMALAPWAHGLGALFEPVMVLLHIPPKEREILNGSVW